MRGLFKAAAALIAPTISALAVNAGEFERSNAGRSFALVSVDVPVESRPIALDFRLNVLPSEQVCGFGNVTLNDQVLPQTLEGEFLTGGGSVSTDRMNIVVASWTFHCLKVDGEPDLQLLQFIIKYIDGKAMEDVGFAVLFRQTASPEIVHIETGPSMKEFIAEELSPDRSRPQLNDVLAISIEGELAELEWMKAQLHELKHLIYMKERMIGDLAHHNMDRYMRECDSLKCAVRAFINTARGAAHRVYSKIRGSNRDREFGHFSKPHFPKFGKHSKPGNHIDGPPKGNHTFPYPPHHKPHFPLPVCRYPPPHHGARPHYRPHHGPPFGKPPGFPHGPKDHRGPLHESHEEHGPPREFPHPNFFDEDKPEHHEPPNDRPEQKPPKHDDGPQGPPGEEPFAPLDFPPLRGPPRGPRHGPKALHIIKFSIIGSLLAILIIALHRRFRNPQKRAEHHARREERHRRRAMRRAARKQAISKLFARIRGEKPNDSSEGGEEEKYGLLNDAEEGQSQSMSEELTQFRNAIEIVSEMISASNVSQSRSQPQVQPISFPRTMGMNTMTEDYASEGEELPAYEDNDDSDSSIVADGFRYTPGSSEYSPGHSASSGVNDILGSDAKN